MKALSIRQPWAGLIVHDYKDIENRGWATHYRGPILIHAPLTRDEDLIPEFDTALAEGGLPPIEWRTGGFVGVAVIVDCVTTHDSEWFDGPYGFVLEAAQPLPFYPYKGALGLFEVPDNIAKDIMRAGEDRSHPPPEQQV